MSDYRQQEELEHERHVILMTLIRKARVARRDGYFTDRDLQDMATEFGLTKELNNAMER